MCIWSSNSPIIASMQLLHSKGESLIVEPLLDVQNLCISPICFELCVMEKKEAEEQNRTFQACSSRL